MSGFINWDKDWTVSINARVQGKQAHLSMAVCIRKDSGLSPIREVHEMFWNTDTNWLFKSQLVWMFI